jgi:hypothetical protein
MKALLLALLLAVTPIAFTGCQQTAATQTATYKTLATVGQTAQAGIDTAAQLLKAGKITVAQYQGVAAFYDTKFQPVFRLAVVAAQSDLSSVASPDVLELAAQLALLVANLTAK